MSATTIAGVIYCKVYLLGDYYFGPSSLGRHHVVSSLSRKLYYIYT
jgi:hypothetical protein